MLVRMLRDEHSHKLLARVGTILVSRIISKYVSSNYPASWNLSWGNIKKHSKKLFISEFMADLFLRVKA